MASLGGFLVERFPGEPPAGNERGDLARVALADLVSLTLWQGDR